MGQDDQFHRTKPCPCGKGHIRITTFTPDHGWVSAYNVHQNFAINCTPCENIFMVDGARIVRRAEQAEHHAARSRYRVAVERFGASDGVVEIRKAFGALLATMRSVAAVHRYLQEHGLESYSMNSFRKHWRGGPQWADEHVHASNVRKILGLLGRDTTKFDAELRELETLNASIPSVSSVMNCLS